MWGGLEDLLPMLLILLGHLKLHMKALISLNQVFYDILDVEGWVGTVDNCLCGMEIMSLWYTNLEA